MGLDIRLPIGLLLTINGVLLAGYGLVGDAAMYQRSLGINVNLGWGIVLLMVGSLFLWFAWRGKAR
jgi:hypothetical protein